MRADISRATDKTVGRELRLGDLLSSADVTPLLTKLVEAGADVAAISDENGQVLWTACSGSDINASKTSIVNDIQEGKANGTCCRSTPLMHEGETIGNIFISMTGSSKDESLVMGIGIVSAALDLVMRSNSRCIMTTEIHGDVVERSFEELMETNRRLSVSEKKYRELSETLQSRVEEKTEELKRIFSRIVKQEKLSSIGRLAAGMAHEINNPAGFVSSNLNTLAKYINNLGKMVSYYHSHEAGRSPETNNLYEQFKIDFILKDTPYLVTQSTQGIRRIKDIVANLKDFAHVDDSMLMVVDLSSELDKALNVLYSRIADRSVSIIKKYSDIPKIEANPADIGLAFLNILLNALESREKSLEISLSTELAGNNIIVTIADNGCGIPEDIRSRIFEPFFTTREIGRGMGLGLTVSYEIISAIGGDIEVNSEEGKGTALLLSFPSGQSR